ncbi:MAG: DNA repair protein RadC [Deltaproteobacteria bacterium]|nr:DNA repair protein RadC [Deltaproteobacteria bacterium]
MQKADLYQTRIGPRERLALNGAESLGDADLIAVLLGTGSASEPVAILAAKLLEAAGGLERLHNLGVGTMSQQTGIGLSKACRLQAAIEIGKRIASRPYQRGKAVTCSKDVDHAMRPRLAKATREHFWAIALDTKSRPIAEIEIAVGGLSSCTIKPADIFRAVLRELSSKIVVVHNHPSGEPTPSTEDVTFTRRLKQAGEVIGIQLVDHIIIAEQGYFSFLDSGLFDNL